MPQDPWQKNWDRWRTSVLRPPTPAYQGDGVTDALATPEIFLFEDFRLDMESTQHFLRGTRTRTSARAQLGEQVFFLGARMPEKVPDSAIKFYEDRFVNLWRFADEQLAKTPYLAGGEITAQTAWLMISQGNR